MGGECSKGKRGRQAQGEPRESGGSQGGVGLGGSSRGGDVRLGFEDFLQLKPVEFLEEHNVGEKGSGQGQHQPFQLGWQR